MEIKPFTPKDLIHINYIQPPNWQDILPIFEFYLSVDFCFPIKAEVENKVVGTGSLILHQKTAWLAHIIVHPDYQKKGIGYKITEQLIKRAKSKKCKTISLLATEFGQPVYEKLGFTPEIKYRFFTGKAFEKSEFTGLKSYSSDYYNQLIELDREISGEERRSLLELYLSKSILFVRNEELIGYFLHDLGEGPVYAKHMDAGVELLKFRCQKEENKVIVPEKNSEIISFLVSNDYQEINSCFRMVLGDKLEWNPQMVYNRIGGYLG